MKKISDYAIKANRTWYARKLFLKMKLTVFITLFAFIQVMGTESYSQETKLNLAVENTSLREILSLIEDRSEYYFMYSSKLIDVERKIEDVKIEGKNVFEALDEILKGTDIGYSVRGRQILLSNKDDKDYFAGSVGQQSTVSGRVLDSSGAPLPGVTVVVKGSTKGTITDAQGNYSLAEVPGDATLVFSFVGMKTQEIPVGGKSTINVTLAESTIGIEEVVAIGYGTVKKSDLTGSVGVIKTEQLDAQVNNNLGAALQGKIAGVNVSSAGGEPGMGVNIIIRGVGTLNNNTPLYIIDDVPVDNINNLNPNDVESIQVLKDASAAAIYGTRAANGVVLISTKTGKKGPIRFDVNADYGIQQVGKKLDVCTSDEWVKVITEMYKPGGLTLPDIALHPQVTGKGTDWQDEIYRVAPVQNYSIGATGGSENVNYNISLGYLNQEGIVKTTDYERLTLRFKSDFTRGRFRLGESVLISKETTNPVATGAGSVTSMAVLMIPSFPVYDESQVGGYTASANDVYWNANPVGWLNLNKDRSERYKALVNLFAEVTLLDGLKYKCNVQAVGNIRDEVLTRKKYKLSSLQTNNFNNATNTNRTTKFWQIENTLSYVKTIAEKHSINAVIGQSALKNHYAEYSAYKEGMADDIWSLNAGTQNDYTTGYSSENTLTSYFGRINYSFDNRYIFTGTIRRDGSSRFGKLNPWGTFPSLSAAWNVANESFFKNLETPVSEMKIRGSWGKLGNQEIGDYQYITTTSSRFPYNVGQTLWSGTIQEALVSKDLKWEATATSNIGLDLGLWNGRLTYTFDWFNKTTTDMLMSMPIASSAGNSGSPTVNAGKMTNKGYEMSLTVNGHQGDFKYSVTGTFSHIKNTLNELVSGVQNWVGARSGDQTSWITYTIPGYPMYSFWLVQTDGLFRSQAEIDAYTHTNPTTGEVSKIQPNARVGDVKFIDANGDGRITSGFYNPKAGMSTGDRVYCGSPFPKYEYGVRLETAWKFIDVSAYLQGTVGNKIYNGFRDLTETGNYAINYSSTLLNSYTFNPNSDIPRLEAHGANGNDWDYTDRFLENGTYCRLKSLQIGFTLPARLTNKLSVNSCRLYVGGDNLITLTKYKGYNPDIGNNGVSTRGVDATEYNQYPLSRSYHFGVQLNF